MLAAEPAVWMPYLQPILIRQGQRITCWQLGTAASTSAAYSRDLGPTLDRFAKILRRWTPEPSLSVPWQLDQPPYPALAGDDRSAAVAWPSAVLPPRLAAHLSEESGIRRMHVEVPAADTMSHPQRITDVALRMIHAWEQDATGIALSEPWTAGSEGGDDLLPDPVAGVAANVAGLLAGRRAVGRMNLGDDRVAVIFDKKRQPTGPEAAASDAEASGMIAVWSTGASRQRRELSLRFGSSPDLVDVWGNTTPLSNDSRGRQTVMLSQTPQFLVGVDPQLALFRSGFVIDEPHIPSTQTPHRRTIKLTNPWPITITGQLRVTGPAGWTARPQHHGFSIPPGETIRLPVLLTLPVSEVVGLKELTAEVELIADRPYRFEAKTPLEVGLNGIRFEVSLNLEPSAEAGATDAVATCIITNTGGESLSLNAFAQLPGHPRRERLIPRLEPGQSVIRQFRFVDAAAALRREDIRLGLRTTTGPTVLNQRLGLSNLP